MLFRDTTGHHNKPFKKWVLHAHWKKVIRVLKMNCSLWMHHMKNVIIMEIGKIYISGCSRKININSAAVYQSVQPFFFLRRQVLTQTSLCFQGIKLPSSVVQNDPRLRQAVRKSPLCLSMKPIQCGVHCSQQLFTLHRWYVVKLLSTVRIVEIPT